MAIITYPLNNITYNASDAEIYNCTRTSGVYANTDNFDASVTGARKISVSPGMAWIKNDDFRGKAVAMTEEAELEFDAPDNTLNRIDRVVLGFSADDNATTIYVKKGTAASSPVAPGITQTSTLYELGLYTVSVPAGLTALAAANITDTRADGNVCGIMADGVTRGGTYSETISAVLSATWTTATATTTPSSSVCNFFQTVTVVGVTADSNGVVGLADTATKSQREAAANAGLFKQSQGNGNIVIAGIGTKPTAALPITVLVTK
nr:MAG TPA: Receptor Binding Protein [Caudoviricetes sp.]